MIELVVVLVVLGVIAVFVSISLNSNKAVKLHAGAEKVAADLQYVRNLALSTAKWYGISFAVDPANTYTVYETDGTTDTVIENPANLGKDFMIDLMNIFSL